MNWKRNVSLVMAAAIACTMTGCGNGNADSASQNNTNASGSTENAEVPTLDQINVGEDYQDITASIKVLTDRTDIVDTVYKGYAEQFMELYPNITVEYEGVTDYSEAINLRVTTGDWGDICFIPMTLAKSELGDYFIPLGDFDTLDPIYNFMVDKSFDGVVYGMPNGGKAGGVAYNKRIWKEAGITEMPTTPDEFLEDLQIIKDNTDVIPLYTNFAAGWTMGQWDAYTDVACTGDANFKNEMPHMKDPFSKRDDMTGPYAVYYILYEAVARGLIEEDPASTDWESSKGAINRGEIATMVLGSWAVEQFKQAGDSPEDIGYMPFPISIEGKQFASAGANYSFGINNKTSAENQIASLVYLKWLIEESSIYTDEGSIPARKDAELPAALEDFKDVDLISVSPAPAGEEDLFDNVNIESEVGINRDDYPDCEILEGALYGEKTLDELMGEWNEKWSAAQESLGVEVTM